MADVRISALPAAQTITGTELVPVVQNGLTVQTTVAAITASPSLTQPFLTVSQQSTLPNSRYFSTGAGLGITDGGAQNPYTISLNGTSGSLESASTGIVVKTAANTITARSFAVSGSGLSLSNGSGVSGNPTLSLSGLALALANTVGTGFLAANGSALTPLTITGTASQIAVTSGDGSGGNPIIGIAANPVLPGTAAVQVPSGTTAQRAGSLGAFRLNLDTGLFEGYNGSWNAFAAGSGVTSIATGTGLTGGPITSTGTISIDSTVTTLTGAQTLTNKTISGASNTLSNIANASLSNSSITINGNAVSLGGSTTVTAAAPFALTMGTGLSGSSYNGSTAVTVAIANTAVTAASYGSASSVATFTVNAQGQLTAAATTAIAITNSQVSGLGTISTQNANAVAITGGAIDGTTVGSTTAAAGSFTTLNSSGATRLGGLSGNQSLQVNNVASAVNYAQIVGAVTGGTPTISALGTDANVSFTITTKGTGSVVLNGTATSRTVQVDPVASGTTSYTQFTKYVATNEQQIIAAGTANLGLVATGGGAVNIRTNPTSSLQVAITDTASAVNYAQVTGAATGAAPTISAQGSDANIGLVLSSKGTGVVALGGTTAANSAAQFVPTTSGVNFLQVTGGATGVSPSFVSSGTDAAVGFNISTKGNANIAFFTNNFGSFSFIVKNVASAVNYLVTTGAVTTGAPELSAQGSDANIDLKLTPKGTGAVTTTASLTATGGISGGTF